MVMLDASDAPTQAQVSASDAAASSGCVLRTTPGAKRLHASPAMVPAEHTLQVFLSQNHKIICARDPMSALLAQA